MTVQYLIDENLPPLYLEQLRRYLPEVQILIIGDPPVPPKGTLDPDILIWCEENNFILITNNRRSLPVHLQQHLNQNRQSPGIFVLGQNYTIGEIINNLVLIAQAGEPKDYQNIITHIPLQ